MAGPFPEEITRQLADVPARASGALIVNLAAIARNYRRLRSAACAAGIAAVVKANAYGLGAARCVPVFEREGCRTFFVATLGEAEAVRRLSPDAAVYSLNGLLPHTAREFDEFRVRPVLGNLEEVAEWAAYCRARRKRLPAAIHLDTGMTRLGLDRQEARQLAGDSGTLACFDPDLIMSHLVCGDDPESSKNEAQRERFEGMSALFPSVRRSLSNSAGLFLGPRFHYDLARPGIALYGGRAQSTAANPVEPVVRLFGRVAQVHWAEAGETVGYGATQKLKRRTRIATVTVGYADGFFRALSATDTREGPPAYIGANRLALLGRISMDLATYDATRVPESDVHRGGWVEILGDRVTVDDLASFAGTIGYEVLTSLSQRYHRIYLDD